MTTELIARLLDADAAYQQAMSPHYDDVLREVSQRIDERGSIGKLDIAALTTWKRLRADTRWVAALLRLPEADVRGITTTTCTAANNRDVSASAAAGDARGSLSPLSLCQPDHALAIMRV